MGTPRQTNSLPAEPGYGLPDIVEKQVRFPRPASLPRRLPVTVLALASGIAGLSYTTPVHALGGGVTLSQSGGITTVTITGALTTGKSGNLTGATNGPFDLVFTVAEQSPTAYGDAGGGIYAYEYSGSSIYTSLSGSSNILTGTYAPLNTGLSALRVFSDGKIEFSIASSINSPPSNCYTGKLITGATGSDCEQYLNVLDLTILTGNSGIVPVPPTAPTFPTTATLLSSFLGTYSAAGSLSSGGSEAKLNFRADAVPSPLPIFGASMAFGFSRRLRRRITLSHQSADSLNVQ